VQRGVVWLEEREHPFPQVARLSMMLQIHTDSLRRQVADLFDERQFAWRRRSSVIRSTMTVVDAVGDLVIRKDQRLVFRLFGRFSRRRSFGIGAGTR